MAEWLYEAGIGESRAALVDGGTIVEAAIEIDGGGPRLGTVLAGRLVERLPAGAIVRAGGHDLLVAHVPPSLSIGRDITVEVIREPIPEAGRPKPAKAVPSDRPVADGPALLDRIRATGHPVRRLAAHEPDALEAAGWSETLDEALRGEIAFAVGALRMTPTPAMTLFDVDGSGDVARLAVAAAGAVAAAIRRHGIGGSIGIDFPTVTGKAARAAVAAAIDAALPPPFERTAVNGFGFLQIVRPRPRASLPELLRADRAAAAARAAMRAIERIPPGDRSAPNLPPAILATIAARPDWVRELVRRTGRAPICAA